MISDLYNTRYVYPRLFKRKQLERLVELRQKVINENLLTPRPLSKLNKEIANIDKEVTQLETDYDLIINDLIINNTLDIENFAKSQGCNYAEVIYTQIVNDER